MTHGENQDRVTRRMRSLSDTYVRIRENRMWMAQVAWVILATIVLGACIAGIPPHYREMMIPAANLDETVDLGRLLPEEQAGLADLGISMKAYFIGLEIVAMSVVAVCLVTAVIIYARRKDSWIAWIASMFLISTATTSTFNVDGLGRAYEWAEPLVTLQGALGMLLPALLLFLFPNGRFVPRWSRWLVLVWVAYIAARALLPGLLGELWVRTNVLGYIVAMVVFVVGVGAQIHRYRNTSTPAEKQQTKWVVVLVSAHVAVAVVITVTLQVVPGIFESPLTNQLFEVSMYFLYELTLLLIPLAFLFAILRYKLWDIDFLINRSLVYGGLTLALAVFFTGSVFAIRQLMLALTDGGQMGIVLSVSTLAVGLAFMPTRRFLHRWVNRRIYGIGIEYDSARKSGRKVIPAGAMDSLEALASYEDARLIGRGGMADVYRVTHAEQGITMAIKVLHEDLSDDSEEFVARFEREAQIIGSLDHPNIVRMLDHGVLQDGARYIVMEYVHGPDLSKRLNLSGPFPLDEAQPVLEELASALDHAHGKGIVHRDLKPSNVLMEKLEGADANRYRSVLTDFGIAKISEATKLTRTHLVGTVDYMAPEQIREATKVDARADVYALGVLTYRLLTGHRPFEKGSAVALMLAHLQEPAPDPRKLSPSLPDSVAGAVLRAMEKTADDRYDTAGEMVADMFGGAAH